ncbi:DUF1614 domain-containing protein [bacterium]|nr:DUF1614 domain-containing protein [bacterium]
MLGALSRLGMSPEIALLVLAGMLFGGAINIPLRRFQRENEVVYDPMQIFGLDRLRMQLGENWPFPFRKKAQTSMVLAVNVGGCLIPSAIAFYEIIRIIHRGPQFFLALLMITGLNVGVCYRIARPVANVGIAMHPFIPPLVAAVPSILLLPEFAPPVAFVAGVMGSLIGADLLHLKSIQELHTGMASIGGAGTFDGIVLSGMIAALLA